tara:strand:+ start:316 stop:996 length:681 start_codon:yes stop_codon:yes gene_type:complete
MADIMDAFPLVQNLEIQRTDHNVDISDHAIIHVFDAPPEILEYNKKLVDLINKNDAQGVGGVDSINAKITKFTGWKSFEHFEFQIIMEWAGFLASLVSHERFAIDITPVYTHCWGMKYEKDDYSPAHGHFPSLWSWVYYPFIEDSATAAPLQFPRSLKTMMNLDSDALDENRILNDIALSIPAKTGKLIMFQSHIYHQVPKCKNSKLRYVLAGNLTNDHTIDVNQY